MTTLTEDDLWFDKADEGLAGAASESANGRFNNCANRCYYAAFHAAVAALMRSGIHPLGGGEWGHAFVQAQFAGQLITRRKLHPSELRATLAQNYALREKADYRADGVSRSEAERAVRRTRTFLERLRTQGGERR